MPRYFFHARIGDRLIWDATGRELPSQVDREDQKLDQELSFALWTEVFALQLRASRDFVITDEIGKVLFMTSR